MEIESMPQWYRDALAEQQQQREAAERQQQQPPAAARHPLENMSAEMLDRLGVSQAWAGKSAEQLAEMERQQRRRDLAVRLGVDVRYLPEGFENDNV